MNTKTTGMTYAASGVSYADIDPFKVDCQEAAKRTAVNLRNFHPGVEELGDSRGESAYVLLTKNGGLIGHVDEGLGTKNIVADDLGKLLGVPYYGKVAQDTIAMAANDLITLGIRPTSMSMHFQVGSSDWFKDAKRCQNFVAGWESAINKAECVWGPGETPTLRDVVVGERSSISSSAVGYAPNQEHLLLPEFIEDGDAIVILESSGIHANGLTLARDIAAKLREGFLARLPDGRYYGDVLLEPTTIYVSVLRLCQERGVKLRYGVPITGHGWRKLMRAPESFEYIIDTLPTQLPIFDFIQTYGEVDEQEMYGNFNMGAGFAFYVDPKHVKQLIECARMCGITAFRAGNIYKSGNKRVVIEPKDIIFNADTLAVR